ncbi:Predicted arabinose efflux permease, MFS family [Saccharopolyspora antimicrobica]|uniref:MFS family arabinose efflux permease n=1 Tax=Saccharopolyspora antimicrobica TaxID=455193 RepID=A0A1I4TZ48_9PSEU|nr:MFS transporter [Saccharopolyspora antimicrobica]RKT88598.1 putative MFS family arabinose efflux permease [Saccharopolyspora antimicrobica]SFM81881.1 Predicted arabinose efflux permease, MFS family [Saccharopolyspora antimicrobica]
MSSSGLSRPLAHRAFRLLAGGRTAAEFGNAVAPVVIAFAVLDLTGSVVDIGIVVGVRSLANVALLLLGGVLADRLPRSAILQGAQFGAAVSQALVAASVLFGFASIPLLVLLGAGNGAAAALSLPAAASLTPRTVPAHLLTQANALLRLGVNGGRITGVSVGGALAATSGSGAALVGNAVAFALAALFFRGVRLPHVALPGRARPLAEIREGWREFRSRRWVWVVVAQCMVINAVTAGALTVIGPVIADQTFGRAAWGLALAAQTAGAFAGGIVAARWQPKRALGFGVAVGMLEVLPLIVLSQPPSVLLLLPAMFVTGFALEQFAVAWEVSLQQNVPEDKLARVYSYDMLGSFIALPVGEVAAGPLAEGIGTAPVLLGGALAVLIVTGLALAVEDVRTLTRKAAAPS